MKWENIIMVDQVKKWMNTSTKGNPRGHSTLTNHTNSVTMIPNHVEMGRDGQWSVSNGPKERYHE